MPLRIIQGSSRELEDADINVIIDVIRAFTVAHYAFIGGVRGIMLAGTLDEAFRLKARYPSHLLAGEIQGLPIPGFELDNSPARLQRFDLNGKYLIQKTTNGVAAALNALNADHVFVTGFTNAKTTAEFIKRNFMKGEDVKVQLIASHPSGDDDLACAEYMAGILRGEGGISSDRAIERIRDSEAAAKFYDAGKPEFLEEDITLCAREYAAGFVMKVDNERQAPVVQKVRAGT